MITIDSRGSWVAHLVECLTSSQVLISWFIVWVPYRAYFCQPVSIEPTSHPLSPSLFAPFQLTLSLFLKQNNKNNKFYIFSIKNCRYYMGHLHCHWYSPKNSFSNKMFNFPLHSWLFLPYWYICTWTERKIMNNNFCHIELLYPNI